MGKAYGMIACTTLIAAGLWITNVGDSPSQAVAGVENAGHSPSLSTNHSATGHSPVSGYSSIVARSASEQPTVRAQSPDQGGSQFGSTNGPVPFDSPAKRNAIKLLESARKELKAGRFDIARQKATEAQQLNAKYAVFEDNPQLVLSEIERRTGGLTFAPEPKQGVVTAQGQATPEQPSTIQQTGSSSEAAPMGNLKDQALSLLRAARVDMGAGRLAAAREKALKAQSFKVTYGLFDDSPELLLDDLSRMAAAQPAAAPSGSSNDKQIAQGLVKEARESLLAGKYDDEYQKATAAQQLDVAYTLLEDRPETVLQDLQVKMAGQTSAPTGNIAQAQQPQTQPAASGNPEADRARQLVSEARAALQAGRVDEAWAKASAASQMNVAYQLFDDTPQKVMSEIEQMQASATPNKPTVAQSNAMTPPVASTNNPSASQAAQLVREARLALTAGQFDVAKQKALMADQLNATYGAVDDRPELVLRDLAEMTSNPFGGPGNPAAYQPTAGAATSPYASTAANVTPVYPATMSADQLFDAGLSQMTNGNMPAAREAFLSAYRQQEQLDPRRRQQLQDFLRELAPQGKAGVQLTAGNSYDSAPQQLDLVEQQRAIAYDRLRSDVMNSIFKAERLREKDPDQALTVLDQALASVENSDIGDEAAKNLINSIRRTQTSVNSYKEQQAPLLDLKRRNEETLSIVNSRIDSQIRVEQELAKMVDEFNTLMDQRRFAEAEVIAKQAVELDPENPVSEIMKWKAKFARRIAYNQDLKERKDSGWLDQMDNVEEAIVYELGSDSIIYGENWKELTDRRKMFGGPDNKVRTETEKKIEESLSRQISLHFDNAPLTDVMKHIANLMGITVYVDGPALAEVGVEASTPISIDVDGIMLKSALNLILKPMELGYNIEDEVLKITNRLRQQGKLVTRSYPVADLVVPLANFQPNAGMMGPYIPNFGGGVFGGTVSNNGSGVDLGIVPGMMQVPDNGTFGSNASPFGGAQTVGNDNQRTAKVNFEELSGLITTTVEPDTWTEFNGSGSLMASESTLSLVIRQTQQVHDQIADLLEQLRRLQDLQVTIEVRFITVSDEFFERIGVDFDFNVNDNIGIDDDGTPPFGSPSGQVAANNNNNNNNNNNTATVNTFDPQSNNLPNLDNFGGSIVGLADPNQTFTDDLDIGFRQGSFDLGVPEFVNTDLSAGASMGFAILSDIEAFFFINAAQGDSRSNILLAPKVTLFNGQSAFVGQFAVRPFVTGFRPIVSVGSVGFEPIITPIPEGIFMGVAAVISADRRYVRLSVSPNFTAITDVQQFSLPGGSVGNFGGVNVGGNAGGNNQGGNNQGGNNNNNNNNSGTSFTIQQPITDVVTVQTTVSVPDGGTVLLGGVKTMSEGRNMAGVPILNKLPYVSRLFKNTGVGRTAESVMLMVTPRIIIQEEEEMLLGIPQS